MFGYVRSFIPWVAFAVISTPDDARYGALVGAVLALALIAVVRRTGLPWDALVIDISSAAFFGALTVVAFTAAHAPFGAYSAAAATGWLALTAWASLAIRRPFTLGIARTQTPAELHKTAIFYRVNAVITAVWAVAFTMTAAALAAVAAVGPNAVAARIVVNVAGLVAAALFTARYPKRVTARVAARI